jgi:hypothetical protein
MATIGTIAVVALLSGGHAESSPWTRFCGPGGPDRHQIVCFCVREGGMMECDPKASENAADQQQIQEQLQLRADELRRKLEQEQRGSPPGNR